MADPPAKTQRGVLGGSAWTLGRVSGIDVGVDQTWLLVFALITASLGATFSAEHPGWGRLTAWTAGLATSLLFFASIVLHELGHSLVAQRLGVRVRSITLFVFGGVAQMESEPRRPRDEVAIAVAGPLVSAALGALCLGAAGLAEGRVGGVVLAWLGRINLVLAAFNVIPGFPLDGGRVLRGIVWAVTGSFERATRAAAAAGSLFAYALMALGAATALFGGEIVSGLWLAFIGWFLLSAARASVGQLVLERILASVRAADVMEPVDDASVSRALSVQDAVAGAVMRHGLRTLYVVDPDGTLRGLVTLRELAGVPLERRPGTPVGEVMVESDRLVTLGPGDSGWTALRRMAAHGVNQLPVVERGRLVGALTRERLLALVQTRMTLAQEAA